MSYDVSVHKFVFLTYNQPVFRQPIPIRHLRQKSIEFGHCKVIPPACALNAYARLSLAPNLHKIDNRNP